LDNASERGGYEIAFCQLLVSEGHQIVFRSTHGQFEQGKDLITVDRTGRYHAYQLKAGHLTLPAFNKIQAEVDQLVRLPIQHPNVLPGTPFTPHLVTNGDLKDPTRPTLVSWNQEWASLGRGPLDVVEKNHLLPRMLTAHADLVPETPPDLERFLRLYLADSGEPLDKATFAAFLGSVVPYGKDLPRAAVRRSFAGAALLAGYVLSAFEKRRNFHAAAQGWLLTISYLLRLAERFRLYQTIWEPSVGLCVDAWQRAALALTEEAVNRPHWVEGNALADASAFYRWRMMVLFGHMASMALSFRARGQVCELENAIVSRIERELNVEGPFMWSEETSPLVYATVLLLWLRGAEAKATELCEWGIRAITSANGRGVGHGMPDPYYDFSLLLDPQPQFAQRQSFLGRSFSLQAFVEFLARRNWKSRLRALWFDISAVDRVVYRPTDPNDLYVWHSADGKNETRTWAQPQDWSTLVQQARAHAAPKLLIAERFPHLMMPFLVAYPHRFGPTLAAFVEESVAA